MIVFRNKNPQKFCYKSLIPAYFLSHLNATIIVISYLKQISSYCKAMNAKMSDF